MTGMCPLLDWLKNNREVSLRLECEVSGRYRISVAKSYPVERNGEVVRETHRVDHIMGAVDNSIDAERYFMCVLESLARKLTAEPQEPTP